MKVLITGGSGFIARNIFEQLGNQYDMVLLSSKDLDLLDSEKVLKYLKRHNFDVVIHAATYDAAPKHSTKDPTKVLEYNLKMFFNLVRAKKYFDKMIYFGSGAEYSREFWKPRMKESYFDINVPIDQYGFSKYLMTKYTLVSTDIYNLRLFGVFGKYDDWKTRVIPNICYLVATNQEIIINQNKFYDFIYIDDLVKIVRWFIDNKPQRKVYNICSGETIDFVSVAKRIMAISGKNLKINVETNGIGREYSGENMVFKEEVKNFVFTPIDESLRILYEWYDLNKNIFNVDVKSK